MPHICSLKKTATNMNIKCKIIGIEQPMTLVPGLQSGDLVRRRIFRAWWILLKWNLAKSSGDLQIIGKTLWANIREKPLSIVIDSKDIQVGNILVNLFWEDSFMTSHLCPCCGPEWKEEVLQTIAAINSDFVPLCRRPELLSLFSLQQW